MMYISRVRAEFVGGGPLDGSEIVLEWDPKEGCPMEYVAPGDTRGRYVRLPGFHPLFYKGGCQLRFGYLEDAP